MDDDRDRIKVLRVGRAPTGVPLLIVGIILGGLIVSIWKPWAGAETDRGLADATPSPVAPTTTPSTVPSPPPTTSPVPGAVNCVGRSGWRIVSVQRTAGRESRSWAAVVPVEATAPNDKAIPMVREVAGVTRAVGYCPPAEVVALTDPRLLTAHVWRLEGAASRPRDLGALQRVAEPDEETSDLYLAPGATTMDGSRWPPGRYIFRVEGDVPAWMLWFGIELVRPSGPPEP